MSTNVEASVVISKLTSQIAQLSYDIAVLQAVNERLSETQAVTPAEEQAHLITGLGADA